MGSRLLMILLLLPTGLAASDWQVDVDRSRIGFIATWEEEPFNGRFKRFSPLIRFQPAKPDQAYFDIVVDVTSVDTGSRDRDEGMADPEWFDFKRHPEAYFRAKGAKPLADDRYELNGTLIVKGHQHTLTFPVSWRPDGERATVSGEIDIDRRDFGIGEGDWRDDASIGFKVRIQFELVLQRQG